MIYSTLTATTYTYISRNNLCFPRGSPDLAQYGILIRTAVAMELPLYNSSRRYRIHSTRATKTEANMGTFIERSVAIYSHARGQTDFVEASVERKRFYWEPIQWCRHRIQRLMDQQSDQMSEWRSELAGGIAIKFTVEFTVEPALELMDESMWDLIS